MNNEPFKLKLNRKLIENYMIEEYGYLFCERCGKNRCGFKFEIHHIIYRSEAPNHPRLHEKENLILLGTNCHNWYHEKKNRRNDLVKQRGLKEIFKNITIFE